MTTYESAFYQSSDRAYDYSNIDIVGRMYPAFEEIEEYMSKEPDKPLLLVEYCHSMGNGPGDFEDYFERIQKYDALCGGFVWEWCDHAIYKGKAENGKSIYYYGGDHGEEIHDEETMELAAKTLAQKFHAAFIIKGGHFTGDESVDILATETETYRFAKPRVDNPNTHGTGCTFSSAIAANLAKGYSLPESVQNAKDYLTAALSTQLDLGEGSGPLDHGYRLREVNDEA